MERCNRPGAGYHRTVGDPVDVVTGANQLVNLDFRLAGPVPLEWRRHYSSAVSHRRFSLGWGHTHDYDQALLFDVDGLRFVRPLGETLGFPPLLTDRAEFARRGVTIRRLNRLAYTVQEAGKPGMLFRFPEDQPRSQLVRVFHDTAVIDLTYRRDGLLEQIVDSLGRRIRVTHDNQGRLLSLVLDPGGADRHRLLFGCHYDSAGNVIESIDPYGNRFGFRYDSEHRLVQFTDRRGYSFHWEYDAAGRCVHTWGDDGLHDVRLEYRPDESATIVTQPNGGKWRYQYNDGGMVTHIIDPYGGAQTFKAGRNGQIVQEVDPTGNVTRVLYDSTGAPLGKLLPSGNTATGSANPMPRRVAGLPLEYEYGELPVFEPPAMPTASDSGLWHMPMFARKYLKLAPAVAALVNGSAAPARGDTLLHDDFGLPLKQVGPDGAPRRWLHDAGGNVVRYHDHDGSTHTREFSSWDLLTRLSDPLGNAAVIQYTATEQVATVLDPAGARSEYVYDLKDRLVEVRRHGEVRETYRYDPADRLVEKRDGQGKVLYSVVIGANTLPAARKLASGQTHSYKYDKSGRYSRVSTDDCAVEFAYDDIGKLIQDERDGKGVEMVYHGSEVAECVHFKRFRTRYQRKRDGTVIIRDPGGRRHTLQPLGSGLLVRTLANGSSEVVQYGPGGRCLAKVVSLSRGERPWHRGYTYSAEGDLLKTEDNYRGTTHYRYDAAHRLIEAASSTRTAESFVYDASGNLLRQPGLQAVALREGNRLAEANGEQFDYNLRNHISGRRGADAWRYEYDSRDMLVRCTTPAGPWEATYDPLGRRVSKAFDGKRTEYYWYMDRLEAELRADGSLRLYIYADALALVPMMFLEYASIDAEPESARRFYIYADQIGTPLLVENDAGEIVWQARIDPYGKAHLNPENRIELPFRFPGHWADGETGLHYNRNRYYSPELGRYLQSDPLGVEGGLNLYAYTSRPLTQVDVLGLCPHKGKIKRDSPDDREYADYDSGYIPGHLTESAFAEWRATFGQTPQEGIKLHLSVFPAHAGIAADMVLPLLQQMNVPHKIVQHHADYHNAFQPKTKDDNLQGKFITIYPRTPEERAATVQAVDNMMGFLGDQGVPPGPAPTTRQSGGMEPEEPVGNSGFLYQRPYDQRDGGDS